MKMKVLIAEDDPAMRHILRKALEEIPGVEVVGEAQDGLETVLLVEELAPQVVFLDIAMPGKSGLEVSREICTSSPEIILVFATAYEEFTREAFEVYAFDYLIKPYRIDRIRRTMERIRMRLARPDQAGTVACSTPQAEAGTAKILVKEEGREIFIDTRDIVFITRDERFVIIHTTGGKIKTIETLEAMEQKLGSSSFFRSHRGFIVNLDMIKEIQPWGRKTCRVILNNTKETVIMTKARAREMKKRLGLYPG